jgi:1-aminocyclopropane-1-carboxylate deaminase/D-cysteine desulfhydrase-like pyridoxal-dependent ACC family enzyme
VAEVDQLWGELQRVVNDIDHVVVYVGSNGSEHAITLAAQLPSSKVTFVGCDCGLPEKEALIQASGLADAKLMLCECGGHWTMEALFQRFMETGEIHPVVA